ncbi:hypothetical protein Tco_0261863 [Tanacetum coccineum]
MPPRMRTRSAGRPVAESRGRGTGRRVGRGSGRGRGPREGNDERVDELNGQGNDKGLGVNGNLGGSIRCRRSTRILVRYSIYICESSCLPKVAHVLPRIDNATKDEDLKCWPACCRIIRRGNGCTGMGANGGVKGVNRNVGNQGNVENQNGNVVNENVQENIGNVIVNCNRVGCSYKEFLACNPKEYDGKGGAVVLNRWIEKMESVQDMSGCSVDQKVKYTAGSFMVEAGHATYIDRFHELARLVLHLVTPESRMIERYVYGLALQIRRMVAATEPKTIQKAV